MNYLPSPPLNPQSVQRTLPTDEEIISKLWANTSGGSYKEVRAGALMGLGSYLQGKQVANAIQAGFDQLTAAVERRSLEDE